MELILLAYLAPSLVALLRNHPSFWAILVLNLLLGWTFVFWVFSLVWALHHFERPGDRKTPW